MVARAATTKISIVTVLWLTAGTALAQSSAEVWAERTRTGIAAANAGRVSEALTLLRAALLAAEELGESDPRLATAMSNLALQRLSAGDLDGAGQLLREALALRERALGPEHNRVADSLVNMAAYYEARGDLGEAELALSKALAIREALSGPADPNSINVLDRLMMLAVSAGRYSDATRLGRRALNATADVDEDTSERRWRLALLLGETGQWAEAEAVLREASPTDGSPVHRRDLALILSAQGKHSDALALLTDDESELLVRIEVLAAYDLDAAQQAIEQVRGSTEQLQLQQEDLRMLDAKVTYLQGEVGAALSSVTALIDQLGATDAPEPRLLSSAFFLRAKLYREQRQFELAITDLVTSLRLERNRTRDAVPIVRATLEALAETQESAGRFEDAQKTRAQLDELVR